MALLVVNKFEMDKINLQWYQSVNMIAAPIFANFDDFRKNGVLVMAATNRLDLVITPF